MRYHNITTDDMKNGSGLRVVLWLAGCSHHCPGCQNPVTWNPDDGLEFTPDTVTELQKALDHDYISGLTFSGGDPLHENNREGVLQLTDYFHHVFPHKNVWLYTGYTWEQIMKDPELFTTVNACDVLVDGRFEKNLLSENYHWAGSTNQRVIDIQRSLQQGKVVLYRE